MSKRHCYPDEGPRDRRARASARAPPTVRAGPRPSDLGTVVVDDIFSAMTREKTLVRLAAELSASEAVRRQVA